MACLLGVLGLTAYYFFTAAGPASTPPPDALPPEADAAIQGFRLSGDRGDTTWDLTAETMALYEDGNQARLRGVRLVVRASGGREYTLTAEAGTMDMQTKNVEVWGQEQDVVIVTNDGYRFFSPRLYWNEKERTVTTDEPIRLVGPQLEVRGRGLVVHVETQHVEILKDVRTRFRSAT